MIKEFVLAWDKNKDALKNYFTETKMSEYANEYAELVRALFDIVINPELDKHDTGFAYSQKYDTSTKSILVIDDGDYQGSQIFVLHQNTCQPDVNDYVYTNSYYGSCSGCDTLQGITEYTDGIPTAHQVDGFMALCLNLLQSCAYMVDGADEPKQEENKNE